MFEPKVTVVEAQRRARESFEAGHEQGRIDVAVAALAALFTALLVVRLLSALDR